LSSSPKKWLNVWGRGSLADFDSTLLSRVEDVGLNASGVPQQLWLDGWLLRLCPGKARRSRCVNALAAGRLPLAEKLRLSGAAFAAAGLPFYIRITPFSERGVDAALQGQGWTVLDPTCVMLRPGLATIAPSPTPPGLAFVPLGAQAFADAVGTLRGSTLDECQGHANRLSLAPVAYRGFAFVSPDGAVQACGQFVKEGEFVGLFDVFTRSERRGEGLSGNLCKRLLVLAANEGAILSYLQVDAQNVAARHVYQRLGFADGYRYHYLQPPALA